MASKDSAVESSASFHLDSDSSIGKTLEALESGCDVDPTLLAELVRECKGDHECEIAFEGGEGEDNLKTKFKDCMKNPGHTSFIPIQDFKIEHLPRVYRTHKVMRSIDYWANLTVKIIVKFVSKNRPETYPETDKPYPASRLRGSRRVRRFGTGNVFGLAGEEDSIQEEACPCHLCEKLPLEDREKLFWTFLVETSKHVIFDASEGKCSTFECFYDSDLNKAETVKVLYGYGMNEKWSSIQEDLCQVTCVTHDRELMERLKGLAGEHSVTIIPQYKKNLAILISHPHGCSKRITIGRILHLTVPVGWDYPTGVAIPCDDTMACLLPLFPWSKIPDVSDSVYDWVRLQPGHSHQQNLEKYSLDPLTASASTTSTSNPLEEDPDDFHPEPATQFLLPLGTTFTLPDNASYAFRFPCQYSTYCSFPPGTKFTLRNGREIFFPPEAEFFSYMFKARVSYVSYSVNSCEGSSGAALLQDGGGRVICCTFPHSGKDNMTPNANRSGLQSYFILPESATASDTDTGTTSNSVSMPPIMPQYVRFQYMG